MTSIAATRRGPALIRIVTPPREIRDIRRQLAGCPLRGVRYLQTKMGGALPGYPQSYPHGTAGLSTSISTSNSSRPESVSPNATIVGMAVGQASLAPRGPAFPSARPIGFRKRPKRGDFELASLTYPLLRHVHPCGVMLFHVKRRTAVHDHLPDPS